MGNNQEVKDEKILCNVCKRETNHRILFSDEMSEPVLLHDGQDTGEKYYNIAEMIKCRGCDEYSLRFCEYSPAFMDYDTKLEYRFVPPREQEKRISKVYSELDSTVRSIYQQTIDAYNYGMNQLCAAGLRTLVEAICLKKNIVDGVVKNQDGTSSRKKNLEAKINSLVEKNILTPETGHILHAHRYLGNDALHDLKAPNRHDLSKCIEILEHAFDEIFVLPKKIKKLKSDLDKRK